MSIWIHFAAQMIDTMFRFKIWILDLDSISIIWASRWFEMKKSLNQKVVDLHEIYNFHIKFISFWVHTKKLQFLKMYWFDPSGHRAPGEGAGEVEERHPPRLGHHLVLRGVEWPRGSSTNRAEKKVRGSPTKGEGRGGVAHRRREQGKGLVAHRWREQGTEEWGRQWQRMTHRRRRPPHSVAVVPQASLAEGWEMKGVRWLLPRCHEGLWAPYSYAIGG
jgi:hypothetical protein